MARPPKEKYRIPGMIKKIQEYLDEKEEKNEVPILKECCLINDWGYDRVMQLQRDNEMLLQSIQKLHMQREVFYEKGCLIGMIPTAWGIFTMKQPCHGWTDKQEIVSEIAINKVDELLKAIEDSANEPND